MKTEKTYYIQMVSIQLQENRKTHYWEVRDQNDICHGRYRKIHDARNKLRFLNNQLELTL